MPLYVNGFFITQFHIIENPLNGNIGELISMRFPSKKII